MQNSTRPGIIFDFDGVLADSFEALYTLVRDAFVPLEIELSEEQYRDFYLENVKLAEQKFCGNQERFLKLQGYIRNNAKAYYQSVLLFPFTQELISSLSQLGSLAIVSSTTQDVIESKLSEKQLLPYFQMVSSAGKEATKKERILAVCQQLHIEKGNAFFVSDTLGDIHEGKELGLKTIAVTWGFHSEETLKEALPSFLINKPDELVNIVSHI